MILTLTPKRNQFRDGNGYTYGVEMENEHGFVMGITSIDDWEDLGDGYKSLIAGEPVEVDVTIRLPMTSEGTA